MQQCRHTRTNPQAVLQCAYVAGHTGRCLFPGDTGPMDRDLSDEIRRKVKADHLIVHPWLSDIKLLAEMLESDGPLPHLRFHTVYGSGSATSCHSCAEMLRLRESYQESK